MKCKTCGKKISHGTYIELQEPNEIYLCDLCRWLIYAELSKQFILEKWCPRKERDEK
jgi:ribosome-binding protein aMBF1 (putative translation factor)